MTRGAWVVILLTLSSGCDESRPEAISDPIPEIPRNQQRTVDRSEFRWQWPFTVGTGTLGCSTGAVIFRAAGRSYAVNEAAKLLGFASIEPIRHIGSTGPPSNPLKAIPQDQRMRLFAESAACERKFGDTFETARCKQRLRESRGISEADLTQIAAEGRERFWPPLSPKPISMDPLVDAGLKLCPR